MANISIQIAAKKGIVDDVRQGLIHYIAQYVYGNTTKSQQGAEKRAARSNQGNSSRRVDGRDKPGQARP